MLDAGELNAKRFELLKDSASLPDVARRAASYVDRILRSSSGRVRRSSDERA